MQIAVWDTYVKKQNGNILHFDIVVPDTIVDSKKVYEFGEAYLKEIGEHSVIIDTETCQFCHIEIPTFEMKASIIKQGYHIIEMDEIPALLPLNPSKKDLILHLKAQQKQYRFVSFKGKSIEEIMALIEDEKLL